MLKCYLCEREFESITKLASHLSHPKSTCKTNVKDYYDKYLRKKEEGICIFCGHETLFYSLVKGYPNTKCKHCRNKGSKTQKLRKDRYIKKREKKKIVDGYYKLPIVCEICQDRFKHVNNLSKHIAQKHNEITIKEYYDEYFKKPEEGICPITNKETNFKNISFGYYKYYKKGTNSKDEKIKKKKTETLMKNYGVDNPQHSEEIKQKTNRTNIIKYGGHVSSNKHIKKKIRETCIERYGETNYTKTDEYKNLMKEKNTIDLQKRISESQDKFKLKFLNINLINNPYIKYEAICDQCNTRFYTSWSNVYHYNIGKCPLCFPRLTRTSKLEKELQDYIQSLLPSEKIIFNDKSTVLNPITNYFLELDVHIPNRKIAFEFNGLYWHSEHNLDSPKMYHLNKHNYCKELDIELIQIFEDEWNMKKDIVKSMIKFKLLGSTSKIFARKCYTKEISANIKNKFLEKNHIQGKDQSKVKLGLFYKEELMAVMTFSKGNISKGGNPKDSLVWELNRYVTKNGFHIIGGAGKLLKYFQRNYEWSKIFTYADLRYSNGKLYKALNFILDSQTRPNYWYVDSSSRRIHRFNLRKQPHEPIEIPEWKLRHEQGYYRIWDCGHLKFEIINKKNITTQD